MNEDKPGKRKCRHRTDIHCFRLSRPFGIAVVTQDPKFGNNKPDEVVSIFYSHDTLIAQKEFQLVLELGMLSPMLAIGDTLKEDQTGFGSWTIAIRKVLLSSAFFILPAYTIRKFCM